MFLKKQCFLFFLLFLKTKNVLKTLKKNLKSKNTKKRLW